MASFFFEGDAVIVFDYFDDLLTAELSSFVMSPADGIIIDSA
jgi:hypothetical protein